MNYSTNIALFITYNHLAVAYLIFLNLWASSFSQLSAIRSVF